MTTPIGTGVPPGYERHGFTEHAPLWEGFESWIEEIFRTADGSECYRNTSMPSGKKLAEGYTDPQGRLHRFDGPAVLRYRENGTLAFYEHYLHGDLHRNGGAPARVFLDERRGRPVKEEWYVRGRLSRLDGPATVSARPDDDEIYAVAGTRGDDDVAGGLDFLSAAGVRTEIESSVFAPLLHEGREPDEIVRALRHRIRTIEGVRAFLGGAPGEWVRAFEEGERR